MTLADIVAPLGVGEFLGGVLGGQPRRLPGPEGRFARLVPWSELDRVIGQHKVEFPRLRLSKDNEVVPLGDYTQMVPTPPQRPETAAAARVVRGEAAYGATLVIDAAQDRFAPVEELAMALEHDLREKVSVNRYASWGASIAPPASTWSRYLSWIDPAEAQIVDDNPWRQLRCPLSSITASGGGSSLNMNQACYNATLSNVGFPFNGSGYPTLNHITWIENAFSLLNQPGKWFFDSSGGYLYYIPLPGQSMSSADVELPVVQDLVDLQGSPGHLAPVNDTASGISRRVSEPVMYGILPKHNSSGYF